MERQIKHIHAEMIALRNKEASGVKLTRDERTQLGRLAAEHDSLAFVLPAHTRFDLSSSMKALAA